MVANLWPLEECPETNLLGALLDFYGECGNMGQVSLLWEILGKREGGRGRDLWAHNALLKALVSNDRCEAALRLFAEMPSSVGLSEVSLMAALAACTALKDESSGKAIIATHGLGDASIAKKDVRLINCLLHFYGECGDIESARELWANVRESGRDDIATTNTFVKALVNNEDFEDALDVFRDNAHSIDNLTLVAVLRACAERSTFLTGVSIVQSF